MNQTNQEPAPMLRTVSTLVDLLQGRCVADSLPREVIPYMLGQLESLKWDLTIQITSAKMDTSKPAGDDTLLNVSEASKVVGMSVDYLYRNATKLPFTMRIGRKVLFSRQGIDRYIKARAGR